VDVKTPPVTRGNRRRIFSRKKTQKGRKRKRAENSAYLLVPSKQMETTDFTDGTDFQKVEF
jgi:hypothetical protein